MKIRLIGLVAAVFALAAIPAVSQATHDHGKGKSQDKNGTHCDVNRGFTVRGLLDELFGHDAAAKTAVGITLSEVTSANRHARRWGVEKGNDLDLNPDPAGNGFKVKLVGYEGDPDGPSDRDKVKLVGKVKYTKKRNGCEPPAGATNRYHDVNIRKAVIKDAADPDPVVD